MNQSLLSQLLVLAAGALLGIFGTTFKSYYDRLSESKQLRTATWLDALSPLKDTAEQFRDQVDRAFEKVSAEKAQAEEDLVPYYNLRYWFRHCKDYIVDDDVGWTDDARRRDFARNSGGAGAEAATILYWTACYLHYATRVLQRTPFPDSEAQTNELRRYVRAVRGSLSDIEFYAVTQDSTGMSARSDSGEVMNYREFGEALTSPAQRDWFLTLTDVYCKLHLRDRARHIEPILESLTNLITFLESRPGGRSATMDLLRFPRFMH